MTPDQIWFLACERDMLKKKPYGGRSKEVQLWAVADYVDENGMAKGRAADGTEIRIPLTLGKSVVQHIRETLAAEKAVPKRK